MENRFFQPCTLFDMFWIGLEGFKRDNGSCSFRFCAEEQRKMCHCTYPFVHRLSLFLSSNRVFKPYEF